MFNEITVFSNHGRGNTLCEVYTEDCVWHHDNIAIAPFNIYGLASVFFTLIPVILGSLFASGSISAWANQKMIVLGYVGSFA
jgi:hypothetical protein